MAKLNAKKMGKVKKKDSPKILVQPGGKWYEGETQELNAPLEEASQQDFTKETLKRIFNSATTLYDNEAAAYKQLCFRGTQKSDFEWMEQMIKVGTLPDKMAAFVVRIQDSPVHNLYHLQNLISMVKVQSKQQCVMAADTLKDLFLEDLLPPNRKLVSFEKRGAAVTQAKNKTLITWIFEDRLKICYNSFINALKQMSLDNVEKIRSKAVSIIFSLLTAHPELEAILLQMLVNKLGDTQKKIASRALFYLNALLEKHPRMKLVVIDEVERLLFRNNIAKRAQYYGVCFLNSINLKNEHPEVACKLINVYVAFFKGCIKTGDIESKMMSALLTGVNKSYPLAKDYGYKFTENTDTLFKIANLSNFNISIQALSILFQLTDVNTRPNDADRYYRVLYKELLRPEVATTSQGVHFLNLIFKSMKCDNRIHRVMGFAKRLLMICQNVQPNLACAILFLLSEVAKVHKGLIRCGASSEDSTNADISIDEETENNTPETDENIVNLMKISNVKVNSVTKPAKLIPGKQKELTPECEKVEETEQFSEQKHTIANEAVNNNSISTDIKVEYKQEISEYDPTARNPLYCGAEFSLAHEVATLAKHYHPSVALFAETLLHQKSIQYEGNPLKDFTVARFLERFVYRNARKPKPTSKRRFVYQPKGLRSLAVNSEEYLKNGEESIPVEEMFFYRYFTEKKTTKDEKADEESETESVGDDEFDELMANYFKSRKGKGGEDDDDISEDLDFAANINVNKQTKKKKRAEDNEESDQDDEENMEDDASENDMFDEDVEADEMIDMDEDDDEYFKDEDGLEVFEEEFDDEPPVKSKKMRKLTKDLDMFAPAEQFAEMLESNAEDIISGPNQLISRDNADPKQLRWEMERDRYAKGYKRSMKTKFKGKKGNFSKQNKQKKRK